MINLDSPESVREQLDAGVGGFHCRADMRAHLIAQQSVKRKKEAGPWALAGAAAALVVAVLGIFGLISSRSGSVNDFYAIEAGGGVVVTARPVTEHEFVLSAEEDHAILIYRGKLYRMVHSLSNPSVAGTEIGTVTRYSDNPYEQASAGEGCISNAVLRGDPVYAVEGLATSTALLAEVDGQMALFQRSGEHGYGLDGDSLQDTCDVLGKVASISLENVGTLEGDQAEEAMSVLMKYARLENAEALPGEQKMTITLKNGLQLELSMSGDQLIGCGVWDCTEFLDIFRALVAERTANQVV